MISATCSEWAPEHLAGSTGGEDQLSVRSTGPQGAQIERPLRPGEERAMCQRPMAQRRTGRFLYGRRLVRIGLPTRSK